MKIKEIWTNYKIYAFILGIVTGTIVYNALSIDFSFEMINQIKVNNFKDSFLYLIMVNLRFWIVVFVISFFKFKSKIIFLIIYIQSFALAGMISVSISSGNFVLLHGGVIAIVKMITAILLFDDKRPIINKLISLVFLVVGTAVENIFFIKF